MGFRDINTIAGNLLVGLPAPIEDEYRENFVVTENSESHIESMMMFGLCQRNVSVVREKYPLLSDLIATARNEPGKIILAQQVCEARYRLDFCAVRAEPGETRVVVIECDGREFHQLTYDQIRRDYKRQRDLTKLGALVVRFLGSEIYADLTGCVDDVMAMFPDLPEAQNGAV